RRIPAHRSRQDRGRLQPQPSHRAQVDGAVNAPGFTLRPYAPADEDAAIELWRRTWQLAYLRINFSARVACWPQRSPEELGPVAKITVAGADDTLVDFVTVDPTSFDLDQIVVAPEAQGKGVASALIAEAKLISPGGLDLHVNTDNVRAIRFYEKEGFVI